MSRKKSGDYMSPGERIAGTVFFAVYLLVLPFAVGPLFGLAELLLGVTLSGDVETLIYYYALLAVTAVIFHGFLARTSRRLLDNLDGAVKTVLAGLVALYGLNELAYRLIHMAVGALCGGDPLPRAGLRQFEEPEPGGGVPCELPALRAAARVAVRRGEPGPHLFSADGAVSGARAGAGLGL